MEPSEQAIRDFQETVWGYYAQQSRDLPWRHPEPDGHFDPYKIMVSEIMLQQTQVSRVVPKYLTFLELFPDARTLAAASLEEVLRVWTGLGYNRRARFLWLAAQTVATEYSGTLPQTVDELQKLPGIGPNTAAAIVAYAYNKPVVYIETNIRTVFIHHFFQDKTDVTDKEILALVALTLPTDEEVRVWYWALMDYGSHLKTTVGNANRSSKHYAKQSTFQGSKRQIRGKVIRLLTERPHSLLELQGAIDDERLEIVLVDLGAEKLIKKSAQGYHL